MSIISIISKVLDLDKQTALLVYIEFKEEFKRDFAGTLVELYTILNQKESVITEIYRVEYNDIYGEERYFMIVDKYGNEI